MFLNALSVVVVGAEDSSSRAASRRAVIANCRPGDTLELRRERHSFGGHRAVGIYSSEGEQIGYVWPEFAERVIGQVAVARAIFESREPWGAIVRVTLDGSNPALPPRKPRRQRMKPSPEPVDEFTDIYPNVTKSTSLAS